MEPGGGFKPSGVPVLGCSLGLQWIFLCIAAGDGGSGGGVSTLTGS